MLKYPKWDRVEYEVDEVGAALLRAADVIRGCGLCKFILQDADGRVCLHGAINVAVTGHALEYRFSAEPNYRIAAYLSLRGGSGIFRSTAEWNDVPERTAEEVIAALEGAALEGAAHAGIPR